MPTKKRADVNPKHKQFVLKALNSGAIESRWMLDESFQKRFGISPKQRVPKILTELKKDGTPPYSVKYKGYTYHNSKGTPRLATITTKRRGDNIHRRLLKHLVDGKLVVSKQLAREYGVEGPGVRAMMNNMEAYFKKDGLRFNRRAPGGASEIIHKSEKKSVRFDSARKKQIQSRIIQLVNSASKNGKPLRMSELSSELNCTSGTAHNYVKKLISEGKLDTKGIVITERLKRHLDKIHGTI